MERNFGNILYLSIYIYIYIYISRNLPILPPFQFPHTYLQVGGSVFGLRESRSAAVQGPSVPTEDNVLTDGTLIDLCGATLLWRSTEGE